MLLELFIATDLLFLTIFIIGLTLTGLYLVEKANDTIFKILSIQGLICYLLLRVFIMEGNYINNTLTSTFINIFAILLITYLLVDVKKIMKIKFDYYCLIIVAFWSFTIFAETSDLNIIYLCLELQAFIYYTLIAGWQNKQTEQTALEGSLKYFLIGNLAGSALILGTSYIYGDLGMFDLNNINELLHGTNYYWTTNIAILLITVAFLLKIGVTPFHIWLADAYEAASLYVLYFYPFFQKYFCIIFFLAFKMLYLTARF